MKKSISSLLLPLGFAAVFFSPVPELQARVLKPGPAYISMYTRSRGVSIAAPVYISAFTRSAKKATFYFFKIGGKKYRNIAVDQWSREYARKNKVLQYNKSRAVFRKTFRVRDGGNYFKIPHPLKAGYYLVVGEVDGGSARAFAPLLISDLGLIVKQSPREILLYAVRLNSTRPLKNVSFTIRRLGGNRRNRPYHIRSDRSGLAMLSLNRIPGKGSRLDISARWKGMEAQTFSGESPYAASRYQVYIDTDRPIYKKGSRVSWYAVARTSRRGSLKSVGRMPYSYRIKTAGGKSIASGRGRLDSFGKAYGTFRIKGRSNGYFVISIALGGERHQANFLVKDYVKPTLSVQVISDSAAVVYGSDIKGVIRAKYLFGSKPVGAKVRYEVYKGYYNPPSFKVSGMEYFFDLNPRPISGRAELITTGRGVLNEKGEMEFLIPTTKAHKNSVFSIRAKIKAGDGRTITDRGQGVGVVKILEGGYILSVRQESFILQPGKRETILAQVLNLENKPVAGVSLQVSLFREKWKSSRPTRGSPRHQVTYEKIKQFTGRTDKKGAARIPFVLDKTGRFRVEVSIRDESNSRIARSLHYWSANSAFRLSGGGFPELNIRPDKRFYKPGDTLRALIYSSEKNATVLLTVEGERIFYKKVVKLRGNAHLFEFPLKRIEYAPTIFLTVAFVKDGRLVRANLPVYISPVNRFLKVKIKTDKPSYKPGEMVRAGFIVTNQAGRGVRSSISLAVVDEGVFLTQKKISPSIQKFFYGRRPNRTRLSYSFPMIFTGGASKGDNFPKNASRIGFKDTAFFRANIVTNRWGRGGVRFKLPSNLTTWRMSAVAVDRGPGTGIARKKIIATKELISRLSIPRFLNTASRGEAIGIVRNRSMRTLKIEAFFRSKGLVLGRNRKFSAVIPAGGSKAFRVKIFSYRENPKARIQFFVRSKDGRFKDSLSRRLPVFETGIEKTLVGSAAVLHANHSIKYTTVETSFIAPVPEKGKLKLRSFEIVVYPNLLATILGSLEYLLRYPHGCVEQTTSRFLPNISVLRFLRKHKIRHRRLEKRLDRHIKKGIVRLLQLQNSRRGGWGWWQSRGGHAMNRWMTAYALYGLVAARRAGYSVDRKKLKKGLDALHTLMLETGTRANSLEQNHRDFPRRESFVFFANHILSLAGRGDASISDAAAILKNNLNVESMAWALRSLILENRKIEVASMRALLDSRATKTGFQEKKKSGANSSRAYYNALAIDSLLRHGSTPDPRIIKQLLARRGHDGKFVSTRDTAATIFPLLRFLAKNKAYLKPKMNINLEVNGSRLRNLRITRSTATDRQMRIKIPDRYFRAGKNFLKASFKGNGMAQAYLVARVFEPTKKFIPVDNGIKVERLYLSQGSNIKQNTFRGTISRGQSLDVLITVTPKQANRGNYLMVSEKIPPGFVVESEFDFGYGNRNVIIEKDRIVFFKEYYSGRSVFRYRIRAVNRGSYLTPPTRAELMYRDSINGSSSSVAIKVE